MAVTTVLGFWNSNFLTVGEVGCVRACVRACACMRRTSHGSMTKATVPKSLPTPGLTAQHREDSDRWRMNGGPRKPRSYSKQQIRGTWRLFTMAWEQCMVSRLRQCTCTLSWWFFPHHRSTRHTISLGRTVFSIRHQHSAWSESRSKNEVFGIFDQKLRNTVYITRWTF